ncbi:V-type ATP synthase subunit F [Candidatus Woesearchaeota archaeon]|nr:V-type ATP synthase subunit F [Candidatus Woesearchaeota archaeon]
MLEVVVVGTPRFVLGFQLAGIRKTYEVENDPFNKIKEVMSDQNIGIIITDEESMSKLDEHDRLDMESSVKPVFMVLSEEATSDTLKKMIKKSIGVDLMD